MENSRRANYIYYSEPLNQNSWPNNMFARTNEWSPGFYQSGWTYGMRPGMKNPYLPRNRWIRHNHRASNSYYFINNTGYH